MIQSSIVVRGQFYTIEDLFYWMVNFRYSFFFVMRPCAGHRCRHLDTPSFVEHVIQFEKKSTIACVGLLFMGSVKDVDGCLQ